ncbi:MAG TPA: hypothetical protein VFL14_01755 [Xanthomonadales bacterium]|nr:hypothetical protein [Xanthomonadales bacterium]
MRAPARLLALATLVASAPLAAQDLDSAFGDAGIVLAPRTTTIGTSSVQPGAIAPAANGGYWWAMASGAGQLALGRTDASGAPDPSLGGGSGRVLLADCSANGELGLSRADDGRVVLWTGRCLQRRNADATLDATFANGGSTNVGNLGTSRLVRDAQGRLVLAGSIANAWHVFRFSADGVADAAFGSGGHVQPTIPSTNGLVGLQALTVRSDGSIVAAGWRGNTHGPSLVLFGLTAAGAADPAFGAAGLVDVQHEGSDNTVRAHALAADADGSVVVAGERGSGSVACCVMFARFSRAGVLDPATGLRAFPLGNEALVPFFEMRAAVAPAAGGGYWIARNSFPFTPPGHRTQFTLVRVTATGQLDTGFAGRGWRNWFVDHPGTNAPAGDYIQLHDTLFAADSIVFLGRTFFEDDGSGDDFVTFARVALDTSFADGYE